MFEKSKLAKRLLKQIFFIKKKNNVLLKEEVYVGGMRNLDKSRK